MFIRYCADHAATGPSRRTLLSDERGSLLVISMMVLYVIILLSAGFSLLTFGELSSGQRYRDAAAAFWLAEAGIARFVDDPTLLDHGSRSFKASYGTIELSKKDYPSGKRVLTSTGVVRSLRRNIQVEFPAMPPVVFNNTMSTAGNFLINGTKAALTVNGRLRVGGEVIDKAKYSSVLIEDQQDNVPAPRSALIYPDANNNGKPDEFNDFIRFNRNLVASYPVSDVVYVRSDDSYTVVLNDSLDNKRIVYIEGKENQGNVVVQFFGSWKENQNLTIISTGTVTVNLAGRMQDSSQLNVVAWSGYNESAILPSVHNGVIYTHGKARFDQIMDYSVTKGQVIANGGIEVGEVWSRKTFNYRDTTAGGMPPGFEGLVGARSAGFRDEPVNWVEK